MTCVEEEEEEEELEEEGSSENGSEGSSGGEGGDAEGQEEGEEAPNGTGVWRDATFLTGECYFGFTMLGLGN